MLDNAIKSGLIVLVMLVTTGCAKNFVVTSEVPKPLINPTPLKARVDYSEEFKNFSFIEKSKDRALESVKLGEAQVGLFDQIFSSLFTLSSDSEEPVDVQIKPQLLDFQYSVPAESKLKMYEIWMKYRLQVLDGSGNEIADWVVKGYGKTPTSMLASQVKAFNTAANVAMRDVGAQLALGFRSQPAIEQYIVSGKVDLPQTEAVSADADPIEESEALAEAVLLDQGEIDDPISAEQTQQAADQAVGEESTVDEAEGNRDTEVPEQPAVEEARLVSQHGSAIQGALLEEVEE